jgi:hypothetical protein
MSMSDIQRAAWRAEMRAARQARSRGALEEAFRHLERAHIVGQRDVLAHTRAHIGMLRIGLLRRDRREILGQVPRILAALTKTLFWVPVGNTGGANVHPLRPMPVPDDLKPYLP